MGDGPVPCPVMIVGEAPGWREDELERPFAGKAGQFLDKVLLSFDVTREDVYITNAVKCRPENNATPELPQIKACHHYLEDEIAKVKPEFILTVGNVALRSVTKKSGIMKHRSEVYSLGDISVFPTIHPAAVLRNPRYDALFRADIAAFFRLVRDEPGATPPRIFLVKSTEGVRKLCAGILQSEAVAYDFETARDARHTPGTIAFTFAPGVALVVPIFHPQSPFKNPQRVLEALGKALLYTQAKRIAQNGKFDDEVWHEWTGLPIYCDFDTMIARHTLDENQLKGLKPTAQIELGVGPYAIDTTDIMATPLPKVARYGGRDTSYTFDLYHLFRKRLKRAENLRSLRLFKLLLMPASRAITDVQHVGVYLDQKRLQDRTIKVGQLVEKYKRKMNKIAGYEFNPNSTQQLAEVMFTQLELPVLEKTKKGARSTKESVLLRLRDKHKFVEYLLEYRKWAKYLNTYLSTWAEVMDEHGRIHPNYKITGTVTGRLSSGKEDGSLGPGLNVQQVPRDVLIRSIIGAPEGWSLVEADFSQVELRIAAHYSQDPTLLRYYQLGRDVHLQTAVKMTNKKPSEVTKEERKKAKAVNFGFLFGMGAQKFVTYARDNYGVKVSIEEAQAFRDAFFEEYPALRPWHERQRRLVRNYKRVQSAIGRVRHLPDIDSQDEEVRKEAERQAINSPVQSLASDMMLLSMILLHEMLPPEEARIVGTIHDALLFEIKDEFVQKWAPVIKHTMENLPLYRKFRCRLSVPIIADVKVGKHWGEGEELKAA